MLAACSSQGPSCMSVERSCRLATAASANRRRPSGAGIEGPWRGALRAQSAQPPRAAPTGSSDPAGAPFAEAQTVTKADGGPAGANLWADRRIGAYETSEEGDASVTQP